MSEIQNVKIHLVGDADLSQVDKEINKLNASEQKVKDSLKQVDTQAKVTHKTIQEESAKSSKSVDDTSKSFTGLSDKVKVLASQIPGAFQVEQVLGFAKATTAASSGIGGTTTAMKALGVAFSASGIGLLIVALGSLIAYFKSTDEGATKLEGIMGGLGAAVGEVVGYFAEFGSQLFTAFESVANFQEGLSNLGEFLVNNLINRFKAFLVIGDAVGKLFKGDFSGAAKTALDASIQFTTGIEGATGKVSAFSERLAKAAQEAYEYAIKMDAVNDAEREFSKVVSENNVKIIELIRQSKNHTAALDERIGKLQKANKLDEDNLNGTLKIERDRLALIQERNRREQAAINQRKADLVAELNDENTSLSKKREIQKQLLSINDTSSQEETNQINKINELRARSIALQERNNNFIAALTEEGIQERLKLIKAEGVQQENIIKQQYIDREIDEKKFQDDIIKTQLQSLYKQKSYMEELKRDTVEIDKSIQDILVKQRSDADKLTLDNNKKAYEEDFLFYSDLSKKKAEQDKKDAEEQKQIKAAANQFATTLVTGLFQLEKDQLSAKLQELQYSQAQELAAVGENKQGQAAINAKYAKQEAEIKRKQAIADKEQAIFSILLSTAQAIAKASPVVPLMAFAAAIGAVQLSVAASKPIPKFNKGTKSVPGRDTGDDSVYAMLRPGEGVMPVERMKEYRPVFDAIFDRKIPADLINAIAMNPDIINSKNISVGFDLAPLQKELKGINNQLAKIKTFEVSLDSKGFKSYLKGENSKTEIENNYARMK